MADLTEAQIREILAGTAGVTPGPWAYEPHGDTGDYGVGVLVGTEGEQPLRGYQTDSDNIVAETVAVEVNGPLNAAHVARLDPATVAALCNMALDRAAAEASLAKANATIERLTAEGLYISEQFSCAAGDIVKLRAQIAELEAALITARWYVETYDTRSQNPEQDSTLTAIDGIVSELLSHRERLAYRHDELVEAVSRPTKEPNDGK